MIENEMSAKARVAEFHRRHGPVCLSDGSKWIYPNGAYRDLNPLGVLAEPMAGTKEAEHRNAENVLTFYRLKLKLAVQNFDEFNFRLSTTLPTNPGKALAELERLQDIVEGCKKEMAAAEA